MYNNNDYYQKLLKYSQEVKCPSSIQIDLDLRRTFPNEEQVMDENFQKSLRNVLVCYTTRNTSVGYCQGMNFVVSRLLLIMRDEEQTFWLFLQIMENIVSLIYYADLQGIIIETTLIETLLPIYLPELVDFLEKNNFTLTISNFIHKWMVCIFTQTLKIEMVYTFLDFFFMDGCTSLIKNSLYIFASIQEEIMSQDSFEEIYLVLTEVENKIINPREMIYYLYEKNFDFAEKQIINLRNILSKPIRNKLKNGELLSTAKRTWDENRELLKKRNINCDPNWPFCLYEVENDFSGVLVFQESKNTFIIDDYYYIKITKNDNKLLIERHRHICDDQKLVDASQNFSDFQKIMAEELNNNAGKNKSQELKIYESLRKFKDVDKLIKQCQNVLKNKKKVINREEIKSIHEQYKDYKYYPDDYSMFKLQ